jgi:hypothetical protein
MPDRNDVTEPVNSAKTAAKVFMILAGVFFITGLLFLGSLMIAGLWAASAIFVLLWAISEFNSELSRIK